MKYHLNRIILSLITLLPTVAFAYDTPKVGIIDPKTNKVPVIIGSVIEWILLLVTVVAVLFIVIGGFKYVMSAGNKEQADSAKQTLTYAVIGLIIVILAQVIVSLVTNSVESII